MADKIKPEPTKPRLAVFNFRHGPEGLVYDPPPEPPTDPSEDMFILGPDQPRFSVAQIPSWPGFLRTEWARKRHGYLLDGHPPEVADELSYRYQLEVGKPRRDRTIGPPRTWFPGVCPTADAENRVMLTALWRRLIAARVPAPTPKPPQAAKPKPPSRLAVLVEALRRAKSTNADPAVIERLARAVVIAKTVTNATATK